MTLEMQELLREYNAEGAAWERAIDAINEIRRTRGTRGQVGWQQIHELQQEAHQHCKKGMDMHQRLLEMGLSDQQITEAMDRY